MGWVQQQDEASAAAGVSPSNHADLETIKQPGGNINIRYYSRKDCKVCLLSKTTVSSRCTCCFHL